MTLETLLFNPCIMKLYHLNPNNYGEEWFVMAESKEEALKSIINQVEEEYKGRKDFGTPDMIKQFMVTGKAQEYTLDEYEANQAVRSEIC